MAHATSIRKAITMQRTPLSLVLLALTLLMAMACCSSGARAQELVINGGFEQPQLATGESACSPNIPGWTAVAGMFGCFEVQNRATGVAAEGNQLIELDSSGSAGIAQTIATTYGRTYRLRVFYSPR